MINYTNLIFRNMKKWICIGVVILENSCLFFIVLNATYTNLIYESKLLGLCLAILASVLKSLVDAYVLTKFFNCILAFNKNDKAAKEKEYKKIPSLFKWWQALILTTFLLTIIESMLVIFTTILNTPGLSIIDPNLEGLVNNLLIAEIFFVIPFAIFSRSMSAIFFTVKTMTEK